MEAGNDVQLAHKPIVVVAGDPAIDYFHEDVLERSSHEVEAENWRRERGYRRHRLGGGVLLLGELLRKGAENAEGTIQVSAPAFELPDRSASEYSVIRSLAHVEPRQIVQDFNLPSGAGRKLDRWFVSRFAGFSRTAEPIEREADALARALRGVDVEGRQPMVVVIDDAGNGFRDTPELWPDWLSAPKESPAELAILKTVRPFRGSLLTEAFFRFPARRRLVVVNAYDLRDSGMDISRRLSWERTLWDLGRQSDDEIIVRLTGKGQAELLVRFGTEGTAIISQSSVRLLAEPGGIEDDLDVDDGLEMPGRTSAFVAGLAIRAAIGDTDDVAIINAGMDGASRYRRSGFAKDATGGLVLPPETGRAEGARAIGRTLYSGQLGSGEPKTLKPASLGALDSAADWLALAKRVVRRGDDCVAELPHARFGGLFSCDWRDVELYRYTANLVRKYLSGRQRSPLSLAVFGAPGSGKSFGVKQIAASLAARTHGSEVKEFEFNLAQWSEPRDLIAAFHRIRDEAIGERIPLVFFDEFDSALGGAPLGWLKLFLSPMQDGRFRDGAQDHAIGRAIFVFAGGTARSFAEFVDRRQGEGKSKRSGDFRDAKGPDFVSRLSGSIDVSGIGRGDADGDDGMWQVRRALVLRRHLLTQFPAIFDGNQVAGIDDSVLDVLLGAPDFHHGNRSLEAILHMSGADHTTTHFGLSDLPPNEQLRLHLDAAVLSDPIRPTVKPTTSGEGKSS